MVVFTLVFGKFANFPSNGVPLSRSSRTRRCCRGRTSRRPWRSRARAWSRTGRWSRRSTSRVSCCRSPASACRSSTSSSRSIVLFGMMVWFQVWPIWAIVLAPAFLFLALVTALGVGLFLSAVDVRYRDVPYAIPFILQLWLFVSGGGVRDQRAPGALAVAPLAEPDDGGDQRLPVGPSRHAGAGRARRWSASVPLSRSSSSGSGTSAAPSPGSRTRSDGDGDQRRRVSRSGTGSASTRAATARCATRSPRRARRLVERVSTTTTTEIWALRDVSFDVRDGRGARHHRAQRRRQDHAAQDPDAHHGADRGARGDPRPRRQPARGRDRLPPRAHRPREHLPERRDPRDEAARDRAQVRRDRRVRGVETVHRHAGEALLERHVRPARVRGRRAPRARDPARRRGARRRRRRVPAPLPRADGGRAASPGARCSSSRTTCRRSRSSATARSGSTTGVSSAKGLPPTWLPQYLQAGTEQALAATWTDGSNGTRERPRAASLGARRPGRRGACERSTCASRSVSRSASRCSGRVSPIFPKIKVYDSRGDVAFNAMDTSARWLEPSRSRRVRHDRVDSRELPQRRAHDRRRVHRDTPRRSSDNQASGRAAVAFHVQDPAEGDSARGLFTGQWQGVVRPMLEWTTEES